MKAETGITDTGESADPLARKQRRTTSGWQGDTRAHMGDGDFGGLGTRTGQQRPRQNYRGTVRRKGKR